MNLNFFTKYEKGISIAANLSALLTAVAGVLTFVLSISPWAIAAISTIGLVIALIALATSRKRLTRLEVQALSIANDYAKFSMAMYQESLQARKPTFAEAGYLVAMLKDIRKQIGHDTADLEQLLEELMFLESQANAQK